MRKLLLFSVLVVAAISFIVKLGSLQISGSNPEAFKTDPAISAQQSTQAADTSMTEMVYY